MTQLNFLVVKNAQILYSDCDFSLEQKIKRIYIYKVNLIGRTR